MNMQHNKRRGRIARDRVADAITTLAALPKAEFDAVQECLLAMRLLAEARAMSVQQQQPDE